MSKGWKLILSVLTLLTVTVWLAVLTTPGANLQIIACDVGQGDAFLVMQGQNQILIDGGPNETIIDCLDKHLPFWDRKIEVVILTHPQSDHLKGLIEVFRRFEVDAFVTSQIDSSSQDYSLLKSIVGGSGVRVVDATMGSDIGLGMMYLDIVYPTEEYFLTYATEKPDVTGNVLGTYTTNRDLNEFSVVTLLSFGEFEALFTGDINPEISDRLSEKFTNNGTSNVEYIKIPHHGSKNGISIDLIETLSPEIAVISVGNGNSYGHPHEEVVELLSNKDIRILRTDKMGDVVVVTDGNNFWVDGKKNNF